MEKRQFEFAESADNRPYQNKLVASAIRRTNSHAPKAPPVPTTIAIAASMIMRQSAL